MQNLIELKKLVDFMRENGIVQCDGVVLGPAPQVEPEFKVPVVDNPSESAESLPKKKLGSDGLTAIEQWENYGRVIDAEE